MTIYAHASLEDKRKALGELGRPWADAVADAVADAIAVAVAVNGSCC
ncbi:MAG TPA: hypothetical protein VMA72_03725 [Streptosporangiaceae bacterium]|nr:hypothetical protein [Streptosporangiaceae bacterium]